MLMIGTPSIFFFISMFRGHILVIKCKKPLRFEPFTVAGSEIVIYGKLYFVYNTFKCLKNKYNDVLYGS